jgi:hypothetical protein
LWFIRPGENILLRYPETRRECFMTGTKKGDLPEMADKKKETNKPLDKMTANELRELAKAIPEITGVHAMKKAELLAVVKEARGIKEAAAQKEVAKEDKGVKEAAAKKEVVKEDKGVKEAAAQKEVVKEDNGIKEAAAKKEVAKEDKGVKEAAAQKEVVKEDKGIKEAAAKKEVAKEDKGIKEAAVQKAAKPPSGIKKKIKTLKAARQAALEAKDKKMATIYRRRISRLKKQTRKAA